MSLGFSKAQQLTHNRIRPKKEASFGKKRSPLKKKRITTDEELEYLNWSNDQSYCCFVCATRYTVELHHVKENSSSKKDHKRVIPLCREHHGGTTLSPHGTPKLFKEKFSIEIQEAYADTLYEDYIQEKEIYGSK